MAVRNERNEFTTKNGGQDAAENQFGARSIERDQSDGHQAVNAQARNENENEKQKSKVKNETETGLETTEQESEASTKVKSKAQESVQDKVKGIGISKVHNHRNNQVGHCRIDLTVIETNTENPHVKCRRPGAGAPSLITTTISQWPHTDWIQGIARDRAGTNLQSCEGQCLHIRPAISRVRGQAP